MTISPLLNGSKVERIKQARKKENENNGEHDKRKEVKTKRGNERALKKRTD